jgi:hypothetical protein
MSGVHNRIKSEWEFLLLLIQDRFSAPEIRDSCQDSKMAVNMPSVGSQQDLKSPALQYISHVNWNKIFNLSMLKFYDCIIGNINMSTPCGCCDDHMSPHVMCLNGTWHIGHSMPILDIIIV